MAYENAIKYNAIKSMKGLPIGAIVTWSSDQSSIPTGWILCSGSTVSTASYPLLFNVIGNTYGGTPGSTFRLPPLTNSIRAVVDVYQGHYGFLKERGEAHAPQTATIGSDPFWSIIGGGENQDTGSSSQTTWLSTIDVVGEFGSRPNLFGLYDDITITNGTYSFTVAWNEQRLGFDSLQSHLHGVETNLDATSWQRGNDRADLCSTGTENECRIICDDSNAVSRVVAPQAATIFRGNNDSDLVASFTATRSGRTGTGGGGNVVATNQAGQTSARVYEGGDGISIGNMERLGKVWLTSRSNTETSIGQVGPHSHSPVTFNLQSRINVISPGLRSDISMNTVAINNEPGRNFCTITANTSTAYLEMSYIIRAY